MDILTKMWLSFVKIICSGFLCLIIIAMVIFDLLSLNLCHDSKNVKLCDFWSHQWSLILLIEIMASYVIYVYFSILCICSTINRKVEYEYIGP